MRKIAEEIVARSDAEEGEFYGIDTSLTPKDGNVVTKGTVEKLHLKAWKVYEEQMEERTPMKELKIPLLSV